MSEQEEIKSIIEVREDFCIKIIHKAAYFLNPREQGRLLNNVDRVADMEFVCELTEKLFSCYSYIHTAKRNRLSNERAAKVVFVSQT